MSTAQAYIGNFEVYVAPSHKTTLFDQHCALELVSLGSLLA